MKKPNDLTIDYGALSNGEHDFDYEVNKEFFEAFENNMFADASATVWVTIQKDGKQGQLQITMNGAIRTLCDRCGDDIVLEFETDNQLLISTTLSNETAEDVDRPEVIILDVKQQIAIGQLIYEYICLTVPMQIIHADDDEGNSTCNAETLKKLENLQPKDQTTDSRWDDLKNIKLN
ncbi:MAG: hypothetical protein RIQ89_1725 [Bacteroidota bacterium]|jgi:uncharacterized metal-binding protein YceD (DUF177 family)